MLKCVMFTHGSRMSSSVGPVINPVADTEVAHGGGHVCLSSECRISAVASCQAPPAPSWSPRGGRLLKAAASLMRCNLGVNPVHSLSGTLCRCCV